MVLSIQCVPANNRLLEALPSSDRRQMLAGCETVELTFGDALYAPGERLSRLFPHEELYLADHADRH